MTVSIHILVLTLLVFDTVSSTQPHTPYFPADRPSPRLRKIVPGANILARLFIPGRDRSAFAYI